MAHFVKIENEIVKDVIRIEDSDCGGGQFPDSEPIGQEFIRSLGIKGEWLQTSFNGNFRGNYGAIGGIYNRELDIFEQIENDAD
jgi:hypothetical protein